MSLVQQIVKLLEPLPAAKRLLVLREAEKIVRSQINVQGVLRKVSRVGKAGFKIGIPVWMAPKEGRYNVIVEGNKLIYVEACGQGNVQNVFGWLFAS